MDGSFPITDRQRDETAPGRGLVNGVLIGLGMWAALGAGLLLLLR